MSEHAQQLQATSDGEIADLIGLISRLDEITLRRPCPGREKLGDGTVGACARHAADNYRQIATFVNASDRHQDRKTKPTPAPVNPPDSSGRSAKVARIARRTILARASMTTATPRTTSISVLWSNSSRRRATRSGGSRNSATAG